MNRALLFLAGLALLAAPAAAHDFWIEPARFDPSLGRPVAVHLRVGDDFLGDPVPRPASRLVRFVAVDAAGERPIPGVDGVDPAGFVIVERAGWLALGYEGNAARLELPAERFERYLEEEGLDAVRASRAARGQADRPGRELFARSAKALLRVGGTATGRPPRLGLPLELESEADPLSLGPGEPLTLRLLHHGRPVAGALVVAVPRADPDAARRARTDADGRVRLELGLAGPWLIKAVHMTAAAETADADWLSWWASLTFAIPES